MKDVLETLDAWRAQGERIALATLVDTHGPAPRPAGARMCVSASGAIAGSVSGGCVEGDVALRAEQVLASGQPVVARYGIDDAQSVAVGLSCGGEIDVLIEPFEPDAAWRATREALERDVAAALCIAIGPGPLLGRRLCVRASGAGDELVGGIHPDFDARIAEAARPLLVDGGRTHLRLDAAQGAPDGLMVFIEALAPAPRLYIVGATHTAIPLARMAGMLGFSVRVIDPRAPFATPERFPEVDALVLEWPDEVLAREALDERAYVLTLTHDLKFDIPTLATALRSQARYIGALGSRRTHARRMERLREEGFAEADLARIHTPIGLDIGARSPEEIALSILAEIVAVRHGRAGAPLASGEGPIHGEHD